MKSTKEVAELIKAYIEGKINPDDRIRLNNWLEENPMHRTFFKNLIDKDQVFEDAWLWLEQKSYTNSEWQNELEQKTIQKIKYSPKTSFIKKFNIWPYISAASVLLIGLTYFFLWKAPIAPTDSNVELSTILPGSNKAQLKLSNGKTIELRTDQHGIALEDGLFYADGSAVSDLNQNELKNLTASIIVPEGGKYYIKLKDGSEVWLNSASKLDYPLQFSAEKREVSLEGEAYFEVAKVQNKNKNIPFIVHNKNQDIEVTGTAFNVSAYKDDQQTITTLVEGSVNVKAAGKTIQLKPNQQAIQEEGKITRETVDVSQFIAWKDNKFLFFETPLKDAMKRLARWYKLDINHQKQIPSTYLYGEIDRDKNLGEVLRILEKSGIKFKIQNSNGANQLIAIP